MISWFPIQTDHVPVGALSLTDVSILADGDPYLGGGISLDNFYHPDKRALTPKPKSPRTRWSGISVLHREGRRQPAGEYSHGLCEVRELKAANAFGTNILGPNDTVVRTRGTIPSPGKRPWCGPLGLYRAAGRAAACGERFRALLQGAVLGFKNYPTYSEKLADRTVLMAGMNIPTFGLLQKLSMEVEHCSYPFRQSTNDPNVVRKRRPQCLGAFLSRL